MRRNLKFLIIIIAIITCGIFSACETYSDSASETDSDIVESSNESEYIENPTAQIFSIEDREQGYAITELLQPNVAIEDGCLVIPSEIDGKNVVEVKSLVLGVDKEDETLSVLPQVEHVVIPSTVVKIGEYAFAGMRKLISVDFIDESGLEEIGERAFFNCVALETCNLPQSVKIIGGMAFAGCRSITAFNVTQNVESIGIGCFASAGIDTFSVESGNSYYTIYDGVLYNYNKTVLVAYPKNKSASSFTVLDTVNWISAYAFCGSNLTSIDLTTTQVINEFAFKDCENLENIVGQHVVTADESAFEDTLWYSANYNNEYFGIGIVLFRYNGNSETVDLREYARIKDYAFLKIENGEYLPNVTLKEVILGVRINIIDENTFANCTALTSIRIINESSIYINERAFDGLSESLKVYVPLSTVETYQDEFGKEDLFTPISSTVEFYYNGVKVGEETAYWGEIFTTDIEPEVAIGSVFISWYLTEDFSVPLVGTVFASLDESVCAYAKTVEREYKIIYNYVIQGNPFELQHYVYGDKIVLPQPSAIGYIFLGWYWDKEYQTPVTEDDLVGIYGDLDFYAKWQIVE